MDFKELCNTRKRMCDKYSCDQCPIFSNYKKDYAISCCEYFMNYPKEVEKIIDKWNKENPIITNADKFREIFGYDICSSFDNPGYFYLSTAKNSSNLIHVANEDEAKKWLKQEYKKPSQE